jgi:hypothetical protein
MNDALLRTLTPSYALAEAEHTRSFDTMPRTETGWETRSYFGTGWVLEKPWSKAPRCDK